MFSQYSWGDFFKFALVLVVPYYIFVAWKYYREDIRDWFANRGQTNSTQAVTEEESNDLDDDVFTVSHYDSDLSTVPAVTAPHTTEAKLKPGEWLPAPANDGITPELKKPLPAPFTEESQEAVEIQGPAVNDEADDSFSMPVLVQAENTQELSLDAIISAAGRIAPDEAGVMEAVDATDEQAVRIANVFNHQLGKEAFAGFAFNR